MLSFRTATVAAVILCVVLTGLSHPSSRVNDFFSNYYPAAEALVSSQDAFLRTMERPGPDGRPVPPAFVNLPVVGFLLVPFAALPAMAAAIVFTILGVIASVAAWWVLARTVAPQTGRVLLLLFLVNGPLIYSLKEGNTSQIALLLCALAFLYLHKSRDMAAGALFAAAGILKPLVLIMGGYFLLRGRWRVVAGGVVMLAVAVCASILIFGLAAHVYWVERAILPFSGTAIGAFNNQSIDAFLVRIQLGSDHVDDWTGYVLDGNLSAVRTLVVLAFAVNLCAVALLGRPADTRLQASLFLASGLVLSPISWSHYFCLLLPVWAFYLDTPSEQRTPWSDSIMVSGIALASLPVMPLADRSFPLWNLVESRTLLGGLLTIAALEIVLLRQAATGPELFSIRHLIPGSRAIGVGVAVLIGFAIGFAGLAAYGLMPLAAWP